MECCIRARAGSVAKRRAAKPRILALDSEADSLETITWKPFRKRLSGAFVPYPRGSSRGIGAFGREWLKPLLATYTVAPIVG
jgi:hypothetical protein